MTNYFELIPDELIIEILVCLDIDNLYNISNNFTITKSKLFWIKKLQYDNLGYYLDLLNDSSDYVQYKRICSIHNTILKLSKNPGYYVSFVLSNINTIDDNIFTKVFDKINTVNGDIFISEILLPINDSYRRIYITFNDKFLIDVYYNNINQQAESNDLSIQEVKLIFNKLINCNINLEECTYWC